MSDPQIAVCQECGKRRRGEQSASLTQWLFSTQWCMCEYNRKITSVAMQEQGLCGICGKRQTAARSGSLTQWLFKYDVCSCKKQTSTQPLDPPLVFESKEAGEVGSAADFGLDKDNFPLERYEPLALLGRGAAGRVFRARDRMLQKKVAIKTLNKVAPDLLVSFQNEARALSLLTHENIVTVQDFGATSGGIPYMVVEYVEGQPLDKVIKDNGALPWRTAVLIANQLCLALTHAHGKGVAHRDLKSANIMIDPAKEKPNAKIIDFGIAFSLSKEREAQGLTIAGTPGYMSPDQAQGKIFDERSEIYSFGVVLYEMLTGRLPFNADGAISIMRKQLDEPVPAFAQAAPGREIPAALEDIVNVCLEKEPDGRFQSFEELRRNLKSLLNEDDTLIMNGQTATMRVPARASRFGENQLWYLAGGFAGGCLLTYAIAHSAPQAQETSKAPPTLSASKHKSAGSLVDDLSVAHYADEEDLPDDLEIETLRNAMDTARRTNAPAAEKLDVTYELMNAYEEAGRYDEARKVFYKAEPAFAEINKEIAANPTNEQVRVGNAPVVYFVMAKIESKNNPYAAEKFLKKALELAPYHLESSWLKAEIFDDLARVYMQTGRLEPAEKMLKDAIGKRAQYGEEGEKENTQSYERLAELYDALGGREIEANEARQKAQALRSAHDSKRRRNRGGSADQGSGAMLNEQGRRYQRPGRSGRHHGRHQGTEGGSEGAGDPAGQNPDGF